jgi:hypothetical protein
MRGARARNDEHDSVVTADAVGVANVGTQVRLNKECRSAARPSSDASNHARNEADRLGKPHEGAESPQRLPLAHERLDELGSILTRAQSLVLRGLALGQLLKYLPSTRARRTTTAQSKARERAAHACRPHATATHEPETRGGRRAPDARRGGSTHSHSTDPCSTQPPSAALARSRAAATPPLRAPPPARPLQTWTKTLRVVSAPRRRWPHAPPRVRPAGRANCKCARTGGTCGGVRVRVRVQVRVRVRVGCMCRRLSPQGHGRKSGCGALRWRRCTPISWAARRARADAPGDKFAVDRLDAVEERTRRELAQVLVWRHLD